MNFSHHRNAGAWRRAAVLISVLGLCRCEVDSREVHIVDAGAGGVNGNGGTTNGGAANGGATNGGAANGTCTPFVSNAACTVNGRPGQCSQEGECREYCVVDSSRADECLLQ